MDDAIELGRGGKRGYAKNDTIKERADLSVVGH